MQNELAPVFRALSGANAERKSRTEADWPSAPRLAERAPAITTSYPSRGADPARTPGDAHSGLGLRIARGIVEAHGGALKIESVEGVGTRAVIDLPS